MSGRIAVRVVVENRVSSSCFMSEHGLSFYVEKDDGRILFDCGQGKAFYANLYPMGIYASLIDSVAISHGHYDHTGGLECVLSRNSNAVVYAHPSAFLPKFKKDNDGHLRDIGMPEYSRNAVMGRKGLFKEVSIPLEIHEGVFLTGEIPRRHPEEDDLSENFCLDEKGEKVDPLLDDQAMFIKTGKGTVVLLGCAHSGLVNTFDYICELTKGAPFRALIGGTHLRSASRNRIRWTMEQMKRFRIKFFAPGHCTGAPTTRTIAEAYGKKYVECVTGSVFRF